MRLAVVIPAYNEATTIAEVARRAAAHAASVIVVDDGSTDGTAAALAGLPVTVLANARNSGKGASLARGIDLALAEGADAVVTLDGDGQHDPDDIPRLELAARAHPHDIIVGARVRNRSAAPRLRRVANRVGDFCVGWAAGQRLDDSQSGFRIYPAALLVRLGIVPAGSGFGYESEILIEASRAGTRIRSVPIDTVYRAGARPSHFRPVVDFARIGVMLTRKIVGRGFDPPALVRSLRRTPEDTVDAHRPVELSSGYEARGHTPSRSPNPARLSPSAPAFASKEPPPAPTIRRTPRRRRAPRRSNSSA